MKNKEKVIFVAGDLEKKEVGKKHLIPKKEYLIPKEQAEILSKKGYGSIKK